MNSGLSRLNAQTCQFALPAGQHAVSLLQSETGETHMDTLYNSVSPRPARLTVQKEMGEGGTLRCPFVNEFVDVLSNGQGMDQQRTFSEK